MPRREGVHRLDEVFDVAEGLREGLTAALVVRAVRLVVGAML
jgi:hypothetical protein